MREELALLRAAVNETKHAWECPIYVHARTWNHDTPRETIECTCVRSKRIAALDCIEARLEELNDTAVIYRGRYETEQAINANLRRELTQRLDQSIAEIEARGAQRLAEAFQAKTGHFSCPCRLMLREELQKLAPEPSK